MMIAMLVLPFLISSSSSVADTPYVEIVPDRYTFQGQAVVAGWDVLPFACCVASVAPTNSGILMLFSSGDLVLAIGDSKPRSFLPVELVANDDGRLDNAGRGSAGNPVPFSFFF